MVRERGCWEEFKQFELKVNFYKKLSRCVHFGVTTDHSEEKIKLYLEAISRYL